VNAAGRATGAPLAVRAVESMAELGPLADRLDALNLASRFPTPFASVDYLRTFLAHDEDAPHEGYRPLFLVALQDDGQPVGWMALRRQPGRLLGLRADRVEFLVLHDNDRPRMACRPEDEGRCAEAFLRHLVEREPGWSLLELMEQDEDSPLAAAAARLEGLYVRRFDQNPNATIACRWPDGAAYYKSLSKNFRASLRSHLNRLQAIGRIEFVSTWEPSATARLLDLHLEVEARSWKAPAAAGVSRHPLRVAFFRALVEAGRPLRMGIRLMLLDGAPIASELNGAFGDTWYSFESTYDEDYREVGAGHLVFFMTVREALARRVRAINLLNNYAYVKRRYGATITETAAVQVFRPWTPLWAKARLGDLRRRLLGRGTTQADVDYNLVKGKVGEDEPPRPRQRADLSDVARRAAETLAACGPHLERLDVGPLLEAMGKAAAGSAGPARPAGRPRPAAAPATLPEP